MKLLLLTKETKIKPFMFQNLLVVILRKTGRYGKTFEKCTQIV